MAIGRDASMLAEFAASGADSDGISTAGDTDPGQVAIGIETDRGGWVQAPIAAQAAWRGREHSRAVGQARRLRLPASRQRGLSAEAEWPVAWRA